MIMYDNGVIIEIVYNFISGKPLKQNATKV